MTRIVIGAKELVSPISANVEPGSALLIGRAPDASRLDWSAHVLQQSRGALPNPPTAAASYRVETLTIQSGRISANHLLVLADGAAVTLYDLSSRNGSWVRVGPQQPVVLAGDHEISISLAGTAGAEPRLSRPKDAQWTEDADFGASVARSLSAWLEHLEAPVQVIHGPVGTGDAGLLLVDDSKIELKEYATLQMASSALLEVASKYVHDQNARFAQLGRRVSGMVAASVAIRQVLQHTAEAAASSRRAVILGPTGVGKELLARSYHGYSPHHGGPFVTVNCALLEKDLLYAQLFGARRGSFTGSVADVAGLIEAADGGTLFLDELAEMSPDVQKALLRFLDSRGEYYRLGEPRARRANVQVVCASNAPLDDPEYRRGRFRDDLWYRIAAAVIFVPPLCERTEDLRAFLNTRALHGGKWSVAESLTAEALALVLSDPWPGNFRDLENFVDRLPAVSRPHSIEWQQCHQALREGRPREAAAAPPSPPPPPAAAQADAVVRAPTLDAPVESPPRLLSRLRPDSAVPTNATLDWERIVKVALDAFLEDHGEERVGWDQLQLLVERYLKPMFVAGAADLAQTPSGVGVVNYRAVARKLHIGDGGTVKTHLSRFAERLAVAAAPRPESTVAGLSAPDGA